jgi:hypothetical protein
MSPESRVPSPEKSCRKRLGKTLLLFLLCSGLGTLISGLAFADCPAVCPTTCYYVDNVSGNDNNAGTAPSAAWKDLFRVREVNPTSGGPPTSFASGSFLCLKRGDTWTGAKLQFYNPARSVGTLGAQTADGTAANPFTIDAYGSGAPPVLTAEVSTTVAQWNVTGCSAHICSLTTGAGTGFPEGQPTRIDMVKFGSVWGTCRGGNVLLYCPSTGGTAALTADYQFNYNTSTGVLAVYDDLGTNPVTDYGGVAAITDGETQILLIDGVDYVSIQHLKLLNQSWYGFEYRGNAGTDHLWVANVYSDTEVPFNFHGTGFYIHPGAASTDLNFFNDEAHRGFYGFDFECQSLPCSGGGPVYGARSDTAIAQLVTPTPNVGGLVGAGTCVTPGDFNQEICRLSDSRLDPSRLNATYQTTSSGSGDLNLWNLNSSLLVLQGTGGWVYPLAFNSSTLAATRLYPTAAGWTATGGFFFTGDSPTYSYSNATLLYYMNPANGKAEIDSYNFSGYNTGGGVPSSSVFYGFIAGTVGSWGTTSSNCLPSSYAKTWDSFGEPSKNPADSVFLAAFSQAGVQDTGVDVVAYKVGSGCTYLNTSTGAVTADWGSSGTIGIGDRFTVHNVKISKDGQWALITPAGCLTTCTDDPSAPYMWQIGTLNLYPGCVSPNDCSGHWTEGFSHFINVDNSPTWQQVQRVYGNNSTGANITQGLPLPTANCASGFAGIGLHQNWSNADTADSQPFFFTSYLASPPLNPYPCAWIDEVLAIAPGSGTTYRFAHTYNSDQSSAFSVGIAVGSASQDGRFYMWTSDWQGTLGSTAGGSSCNLATNCRGDVFVVNLGTPAGPSNSIVNATLSNVKAYFNRSFGLNDATLTGTAAHYSYSHFYGNQIKWPLVGDVNGGVAGTNVISGMIDPAVNGWKLYTPRVALNFGDVGRQSGADTAFNAYESALGSAPVSIGVATNYPVVPSLVSEIQGWVNAGYDISLLGLSDTSYQNPNALIVHYTGAGSAAAMTVGGSPLTLSIAVTGAADSVSYNLTNSSYLTIQQVEFALRATGKFSAVLPQPCDACSWITGSAMLSADLAQVTNIDVRTAPYTMQVNLTTFLNSELSGAKTWVTGNLTGVSGKYVYWWPGEFFCSVAPCPPLSSGTPESFTISNSYDAARGAISMQAGADGIQGGYDLVAAAGVDAHGLVTCQMSGWNGLTPVALAQTIQVLTEKAAVWGVPWLCYFQPGTLSNTQLARVVADFAASGVTLTTNSALATLLEGKTNVPAGSTSYAWGPDGASSSYDGTETYLSPTVGKGLTLSTPYAFDVWGRQQAQFRSGWDMGATVLVPVYLGMRPGH